MAIIPWRRPAPTPPLRGPAPSALTIPGAYAGRARFRPRCREVLPAELQAAFGRVVELGYAGTAGPYDAFAGQKLYLEWLRDEVFDGFLIPEQDLEFL